MQRCWRLWFIFIVFLCLERVLFGFAKYLGPVLSNDLLTARQLLQMLLKTVKN